MPLENDRLPEPDIISLLVAEISSMDEPAKLRVRERVGLICGRLTKLAEEQVQKKNAIEQRWLDDLRQYHGRYDPKTESDLKAAKQSRVFANMTRPKTNAWAARISDTLFPTDDKNWAIGPTPVPEMVSKAQFAKYESRRLVKRANTLSMLASQAVDDAQKQQLRQQAEQSARQAMPIATEAVQLDQVMEEARTKAAAMELEIDDQLTEARYPEKARIGIRDFTKLGTVILKGPLSKTRVRGKWETTDAGWALNAVMDPRPEMQRVDPWHYFPDMAAATVDEAEFHFERHLCNRQDLRNLARKPGFDRPAIRDLLKGNPKDQIPNYLQQIREITSNQAISNEHKYLVWEYHGPLTGEEIDSIARAMLPPEKAAEVIATLTDDDPLNEHLVVLWFSDNKPIKMAPHPLDSGDAIYSAASFVEDPSSIFGFGVPYLARNAQAIINAAWRMMMDNADMSVGPQIVINRNLLEPGDGDWAARGFKQWFYIKDRQATPGTPEPFQTYQTNSNLQYLLEVIKLGMMFLDEEISLPLVAQGEQGTQPINTASGMSMLMNAANVIFRDAVRNWDDKITMRTLTRCYDWNMQHSEKAHIKGDFEVKARGSSVLLVRDMQTQNLTMFLNTFGQSEAYAKFINHHDGLIELSKTMMIDSAKVVKSTETVEREDQERAAAPKVPSPEEIKLQIAQEDNTTKQNIAGLTLQTRMLEAVAKGNVKIDEINAMLERVRMQNESKERATAIDAALTQRQIEIKKTEPKPNIATTGTTQ